MDATLDRIDRAQRSIAPGLDALVARHLPPSTVSRSSGVQPMSSLAIEVSASPKDQPAIRVAANQIATDAMFPRELNAEFRRLERAWQQLQALHDALQVQLQKLQVMVKPKGST